MGFPSMLSLYSLLIRSVIVGFPILLLSLLTVMKLRRRTVVELPILGHLPSLICNINRIHYWIVEWFKESGAGTVVFHGPVFAGMEIVCTCDPQNIEYMTKTNFANFDKGPHFVEMFDFLGNGIFNADGESWFLQRKMAVSRLVSKRFRSFCSEKNEEVVREGLLPVLRDAARRRGSTVDLQDVFKRFAFDATFASVLGRNPGFLSVNSMENEFSNALDTLARVAFLRHTLPSFCWKALRFLGLGWEKRYDQSLGALDRHLSEFISVKKQELADGKLSSDVDLLATYMRSNDGDQLETFIKSTGGWSNAETFLRDTALTFIFAGQDTISSGLTWFFWLLSRTPSVEAKILEELKLVMSCSEKKTLSIRSTDDRYLNKLKYLEAAILESMRLYPPVPIEHKSAKKEDVLPDGTVVRPGIMITFSLFAMGRMEWIWGGDCLDFKPERWIDEKDGSVKLESASRYPVFNVGPRACLGKRMGMTMMKTAVAAILLNFCVKVVEGQSVRPVASVILKIKDGLKVTITDRREEVLFN